MAAGLLESNARIEAEEVKELGDETIQAMGRSFNCKVYQMKDDTVDGKERPWGGKGKFWVSSASGVGEDRRQSAKQIGRRSERIVVYELTAYDGQTSRHEIQNRLFREIALIQRFFQHVTDAIPAMISSS